MHNYYIMTRFRQLLVLFVALFFVGYPSADCANPGILNRVNKMQMEKWVNATFSKLSPDEKIEQLMVMMVRPEIGPEKSQIKDWVTNFNVGGLLFAEGTTVSQAELTNYAQSISKVPLMITLDGEWGLNMRLSDAPRFPRNLVVGALSNQALIYNYGREVARECRRMGIHVNFAPDLDVNDNPDNPVIGTRSFGDNPSAVAHDGIAYAKGLEDGGVLSAAKHFPGHGSTSQDSHKSLPTVTKNGLQLNLCELAPFRKYINAGLSGVLVGHLYVPAIDKREIPSSLSEKYVNELLVGKMKFNGLIFTDALNMKGALSSSSASICVQALKAGDDLLLAPLNLDSEVAAIKAAVANGTLSQALIDEKCKKMLRYKYALGLSKPQKVAVKDVSNDVYSAQAEVLRRKMWAGAMTVFKNNNSVLPLKNLDAEKIAVVSLGAGTGTFFQTRCAMYSETSKFSYNGSGSINSLVSSLKGYNTILVGVYDNNASTKNALASISANCRNVIPVFFIKAFDVAGFKNGVARSSAAMLAYEDCDVAQDYAAQTVYGGNAASGILPISLEGIASHGAGFKYAASRLGYTVPEEVGVNSSMLNKIDALAKRGLSTKAFPGCQVLVAKDGKIICNRSYGVTDPATGTKVTVNTLYDLASVSKTTGTLPGIMKAYDSGLIRIDNPASVYIPQLRGTDKSKITLRQLLFHETGMPPVINMFNLVMDKSTYTGSILKSSPDDTYSIKVMDGAYGNKFAKMRTDIFSDSYSSKFNIPICKGIYGNRASYDTVMRTIYNVPLRADRNCVYSCLNFALLMNVEENVTHKAHNDYVTHYIYAPLGANHILYRPLTRFPLSQIAPTEQDTYLRRQVMRGYVHDEMACFSGGVQGNAGLFSNANDLAKLCQMWLNGGIYGGKRVLSASTVKLFTTVKSPNSRRGLGFDKPNKKDENSSPTCSEAPGTAYGHLGFTGTCFWVDPTNHLIFIFLCNRVYPTRNNEAFSDLDIRPHLFSEVYKSIIHKAKKSKRK
jgi:beta-N-acetylhexosaminidase